MAVAVFIVVLSILIILHEYGHFAMAKALGVEVERFSIGFGPKLFGKNIKGTEFTVCLIPLGGYVKMAGDERSECKGAPTEFFSQSPGRRALIVMMGPIVNYVLAIFCFWLVFTVGYPTLAPKIGEVLEKYPAQMVGLQKGDTILAIDSQTINSWEDLQRIVSHSQGKPLRLTISRGGQRIIKNITPTIERLKNIFNQEERIPVIGIRPEEKMILIKYNPATAAVKAVKRVVEITTVTYKALYRLATGAMSAKETVTGPIGIFFIIKQAVSLGASYVIYVMAVISTSLAIFNLLPFPVLDGGHLMFLGIERLRGKPLPEKADEIIARVGFSFIIVLALFVFYSDFVKFGVFDKIMDLWQKFRS